MITEYTRFRALLDTKTLQGSIDTIEEELDSDEWWCVGIIEGGQDEWSDLFDKRLGKDTGWDEMDEKNKWIWKEYFSTMIEDLKHPGAPDNAIDPAEIDHMEGDIRNLEQQLADVKKEINPEPLAPDPGMIPEPAFPAIPDPNTVQLSGEDMPQLIGSLTLFLLYERTRNAAIFFNLGWGLEQCRVLFAEMQRNNAPGTDTVLFKGVLASLDEITSILETGSVFYD
jgi:hypothetical protein